MTASFMPHGMCYLWKPWLVGLHLLSSAVIALAYFSIPITLLYILSKRKDIPFNGIFLLFAAFILCCGIGHAFDIWTLWHPNYWVSGWIRLTTALVSLTTAIALAAKIPQILTLPSPAQMTEINQKLQEKITQLEEQKATIDQQEQFLRSIYNNVFQAIFVIDVGADGKFYYQGFNAAAQKLTGVKEVIDRTPEQIFPTDIATAFTQRYQKCIDSQATISYEECVLFKNKKVWCLTTLNPIKNEQDKVYRIVGTTLNISERKNIETELDREKNFLQALLDNLSDGIVSCDQDGVITLFNEATRDFHGLPEKAIPAEEWATYYNLYFPDGKTMMPKEEIPLFRALKGDSVRDVEMMIIPKQGQPRTLLANGDPIIDRNGEKIGAIVAMRDISDRKIAEQALAQLNHELAKLNNELEIRVQERTIQLEQVNKLLFGATEQLRKSNQELEQFAYIASHDLKAPLRAIANLSEWIEEDLADKLDEESKRNMNLLRGRVHRLENLINGLLAYSRVGKTKSDIQSVDLKVMLAEIIDLLDVPQNFQIEIQGEMPTFVTQETPLRQVFSNLIANAIQHSHSEKGKITISALEQENNYLFSVADNGKGIDPKYHDRIFTIFQTLEARDTKESTGIGLAIVKKAVENQGGTIQVKSQLGLGTTFIFTWGKNR
jgi:PAS domain S-box-containing protein